MASQVRLGRCTTRKPIPPRVVVVGATAGVGVAAVTCHLVGAEGPAEGGAEMPFPHHQQRWLVKKGMPHVSENRSTKNQWRRLGNEEEGRPVEVVVEVAGMLLQLPAGCWLLGAWPTKGVDPGASEAAAVVGKSCGTFGSRSARLERGRNLTVSRATMGPS